MSTPLPGGYADELMWHLQNCPTCIAAKVFLTGRRCPRGQQLIRLTTEQRHGRIDRDDERGTPRGA